MATAESAFAPIAPVASFLLFVWALVALWELATLPFTVYTAVHVEGAYTRAPLSIAGALAREAPAVAATLAVATCAAAVVHLSTLVSARWWWVLAAAALSVGLVTAIQVGPIVLAQLGSVRPVARRSLAVSLLAVIDAAKVPVAGVREWAVGSHVSASALVAGVGRHRYVLLSSDMARTWSDDEVAVVVAHELAHHAHYDLWRAMTLDAAILAAGLSSAHALLGRLGPALGVSGPAALSALPLVALVSGAMWLMATPIRRAQSRRHERRADAFALSCTGAADAFRSAVRRLSAERLAEERPSSATRWLFHRHPPVAERLAVADAYRREGSSR
ncbi:MAG: M48 family metalloprotease [Acidobacteria bacterium]|nr:M48 family metalloprotease [Acidobacteriota bacterium]